MEKDTYFGRAMWQKNKTIRLPQCGKNKIEDFSWATQKRGPKLRHFIYTNDAFN